MHKIHWIILIASLIVDSFSVEKLNWLISNHTPAIRSFLSSFTQRFNADDDHLYDILSNETLWITSIPFDWSGSCFTYNPQMQSDAGYWYSMFITPNVEAASGSNYEEKRRNLFNDMKVFLHEPNKHFYSDQEDGPNNIGVDLTWMQLNNKKSRIVGNWISFVSISCSARSIKISMYLVFKNDTFI